MKINVYLTVLILFASVSYAQKQQESVSASRSVFEKLDENPMSAFSSIFFEPHPPRAYYADTLEIYQASYPFLENLLAEDPNRFVQELFRFINEKVRSRYTLTEDSLLISIRGMFSAFNERFQLEQEERNLRSESPRVQNNLTVFQILVAIERFRAAGLEVERWGSVNLDLDSVIEMGARVLVNPSRYIDTLEREWRNLDISQVMAAIKEQAKQTSSKNNGQGDCSILLQ